MATAPDRPKEVDVMNGPRFAEQVAIVTGGADGIGKGIARRLVLEGCRVALFDINPANCQSTATELQEEALRQGKQPGPGISEVSGDLNQTASQAASSVGMVTWHVVDVTSEDELRNAVQTVVEKWGRLDIAVNCAGILGPNGMKIADVSVGGFDLVHRINMTGSFLLTKHCIPHMLEHNYGRVLLVASLSGKIGNPGQAAYSSSKAAVIGLAESVGKEYADTGITVNSLSPATIYTQLVANMHPNQVKYNTERIPMKRCGTVEEAASMACFIVSKEASFNTGFNFDLSGGRAPF
ncbi:2-dehydro-3-deoxy-L-rhamnonate dehydrogenase (NAD(+))-like [Sycon ciliatum]|uniref:2-dehydro-3-deoxy-L-rhamnonate dehydrogenase (NAD(+))-like n=1 Tax=Sycon ciliatum TaxID=27933 RepID=UPI0031F6F03C|eukprot:scpid4578/ scgid4998/ Uncharacterized oxidoreductase yxjF